MTLKIAFLGDICLSGKFDLNINQNAYAQFDEAKNYLKDYDLIIGNLESPFTELTSSRVCKAIHIKSSPINVELLQYLGISAVSLGNNHIFDYGEEGYKSTLATLVASGIDYFGTSGRSIIIEKNSERIMLGGFCCLSANPSKGGHEEVNILNYDNLKFFFENAKTQKAFPIASVHWGDENTRSPRKDHVRFAHVMASEYDFLLHGHHPHVTQDLEMYKNSLIAYSLGNFCTDEHISWSVRNMSVIQSTENKKSFILGVAFENGKIISHEEIPFFDNGVRLKIENYHDPKSNVKLHSNVKESKGTTQLVDALGLQDESLSQVAHSRYTLSWFVYRLNYHFIGAFLKGLSNRVRYHIYFRKIRRMADNLDSRKGL